MADLSPREALARLIADAQCAMCPHPDEPPREADYRAADAILAAGWRPAPAVTEHAVRVCWDDGTPLTSLVCNADPEAPCHAEWDCGCDWRGEEGIEAGKPWHESFYAPQDTEVPVRHHGRFTPSCSWQEAYEVDPASLTGEVLVPVEADWDSETFVVQAAPHSVPVNVTPGARGEAMLADPVGYLGAAREAAGGEGR